MRPDADAGAFGPEADAMSDSLSSPAVRAFIGPDVDLLVPCGANLVESPIASVDVVGGCVSWAVSWQGDPSLTAVVPHSAMGAGSDSLVTCDRTSPTVVSASFTAPLTAVPGDAFDGVVTVHAEDGSFADGTVKVHVLIVIPRITLDRTAIDFGDVPLGATKELSFRFAIDSSAPVLILPDEYVKGPFNVNIGGPLVQVTFEGATPGDYASSFTWTAPALPGGGSLPAACVWTTTTPVNAHVLGLDGGGASSDIDAPTADSVDAASSGQ
jgi:hypothetical protein